MATGYASFTALYNFTPRQLDEIELRVGDVVLVKRPFDIKDWIEGVNQRTKQCGQIPGNYLKEINEFPESLDLNGHTLQKICRSAPVCCAICSDYIWGKRKLLYQCQNCTRAFHLICAKDCDTCPGFLANDDENPYDTLAKGPDEWSEEDVLFWMASTNLFDYAYMFLAHEVDGRTLLGLDDMRLGDMGIHDHFHRDMILACVNELIGNSETRKTRKDPGMKVGQKGSVDTHSFVLQTFTSITWCHECGQILFGLVRQGLQCTKCELICHRKCTHHKILRVCPKKTPTNSTYPVYIPLPQPNTVPAIVRKCIGAVESRGLNTWNIYRKQPEECSAKYALRKALYQEHFVDSEEVDMKDEEWINPLCPSAVLLSYLNELPNSILPPDYYEKFIEIAEIPNGNNSARLEDVFNSLPPVNMEIVNLILEHLNRVIVSENSMSEVAIGEIFGPIILRPSQENLIVMAKNLHAHTRVVQLLLALRQKMNYDEGDQDDPDDIPPVPPRPSPTAAIQHDIEKAEWYWGLLDGDEASRKLAGCRDGSFLVRDSRRQNGYTLMLIKDGAIKLIRIEYINGKYGFTDPCEFSSVPELIEFYRTQSLKEYHAGLDIMLTYPICREVWKRGETSSSSGGGVHKETEVSEIKRAARILKKAGELFNDKSNRYEELSDSCLESEQEITALEEAVSAQKEIIDFLEEQVKIHLNFKREAPSSERASLDVNYNLLADRLSEQRAGLDALEQQCLEKSEERRKLEAEMNRIKPDLWELQHKKEKYMKFLEEREMQPEEVELLAGNTDFKIYEFPMTEEEKSVNLSPEYWLFGVLDRDTVKSHLSKTPDGTFLVRESINKGMKAISIMFNGAIKHFCIEEGPEGFGFSEGFNNHPTLQSLVEYYHGVSLQMHNSGLATTLRFPVRCIKPNIPPWNKYARE